MKYMVEVKHHWGPKRGKEYVGPMDTREQADAIADLVRDTSTGAHVLELHVPPITVETGMLAGG